MVECYERRLDVIEFVKLCRVLEKEPAKTLIDLGLDGLGYCSTQLLGVSWAKYFVEFIPLREEKTCQILRFEYSPTTLSEFSKTSPMRALSELIWNAYDADATKVSVTFEDDILTRIETIRISDNGTGIDPEQAEGNVWWIGCFWENT